MNEVHLVQHLGGLEPLLKPARRQRRAGGRLADPRPQRTPQESETLLVAGQDFLCPEEITCGLFTMYLGCVEGPTQGRSPHSLHAPLHGQSKV